MPDGFDPSAEEPSSLGFLTAKRFVRVVGEHWLWLAVFLAIGASIAWSLCRALPNYYEASRSFTLDLARMSADIDGGETVTYGELYNTRLYEWRSDKLLAKVVERYRGDHPERHDSDQDVADALGRSKICLERNSRLITVSVRAPSTNLCCGLVLSYVDVIAAHSIAENARRNIALAELMRKKTDAQRQQLAKMSDELTKFRVASRVVVLRTELEQAMASRDRVANEVRDLDAELSELVGWGKVLVEVKRDPKDFGTLSAKVPRAQEIQAEYKAMREMEDLCRAQLGVFTKRHPGVRMTGHGVLAARQRFADAVQRAADTCRAKLVEVRALLKDRRRRLSELTDDCQERETRIATMESNEKRLATDLDRARRLMAQYAVEESHWVMEKERQDERVVTSGEIELSDGPVFPNPLIVYSASLLVAFAAGICFILVIDARADPVTGLKDIESRIGLPVLTVIPHVRHDRRIDVARLLINSPRSRFAESIAHLRNLLESTNYEGLGYRVLVVSTQPGEGKSITSTSLAIAFAQGGKRTLLVDFDLRRPRQATIWDLHLDRAHSFSHFLQDAPVDTKDFSHLVTSAGDGMPDVIASLPPDGVYPSVIFGSRVVRNFFVWARRSYDRLVIDAPPFGCIGDVVVLATKVDSTLIMCRPGRTSGYLVQACNGELTDAGANVLGVVVNDADTSAGSPFAVAWRENEVAETACLSKGDAEENGDEVDQARDFADED